MPLPHAQRIALDRQLLSHEGLRLKPYRDTLGHLTIGIGHLLSKGISRRAVEVIYEDDLQEAITYLHAAFPWTAELAATNPIRYRALVDLAFNLGPTLAEFRQSMGAAKRQDWEAAANGFEASKWFTQVGRRGPAIVSMLRTGHDPYNDD